MEPLTGQYDHLTVEDAQAIQLLQVAHWTGAGGAVLGSPLTALVWLANTIGARGVVLEEGQVILPGSVTTAIPVGAGDTVTATFAGLGSVTARFSGEES